MLQVVRKDAAPIVLEGFSVVDEEKLMALPDAELLKLARDGHLPWIYAHLMSLGNVSRLSERLETRINAAAAEPAAAKSKKH